MHAHVYVIESILVQVTPDVLVARNRYVQDFRPERIKSQDFLSNGNAGVVCLYVSLPVRIR
jgi:hypothetical protein